MLISGLSGVTWPTPYAGSGGASKPTRINTQRAQLADRHVAVNTARRALQVHLKDLENLRGGQSTPSKAQAVGQADLSVEPSYSTLTSTEEMNTASTSYASHQPSWDGSESTAPITVSGTYDGRYGDTALEFRVARNRTTGGSRAIRLRIYDGGSQVDNLRWDAGQTGAKTSKSGLTVDLGGGGDYVRRDESFQVDVFDSVGSDVATNASFDSLNAELESTITDGSFSLNGTSISVFASDTLDDVVSRINSSDLGVTASTADDRFTLTQDTYGAADITVGDDTSGFLDAVKLSSAQVDRGRSDDVRSAAIGNVDGLEGVASGSFTINGETFAISSTDSLSDILGAINTSNAGVTASLDPTTGTLRLKAGSGGETIDLQDGTGLFDAFDIANDEYAGRDGGGLAQGRRQDVAAAMLSILKEMNTLLEAHDIKDLKGLKNTVDGHFEGDAETDWGLELDLDGEASLDQTALERALREDPEEVFNLLLGAERGSTEDRTGLLDSIISRFETLETNFGAAHGYTGLILNRTA